MIYGDKAELTKQELNVINRKTDNFALYSSINFREECRCAGFEIDALYPVYHQGWEMDEWAAKGNRKNQSYWLETDHGLLKYNIIPPGYVERILIWIKKKF